jgi:RNA polymerase sigma factor (TIGR02999 family)
MLAAPVQRRTMHQSSDRSLTRSSDVAPDATREAVPDLFARVYGELKALAHRVRTGRASETLDTTALVHEAYIKLSSSRPLPWNDEGHFFAVAARAMRQVLVDAARHRLAQKRGGGEPILLSYDDGLHAAPIKPDELVALDDALGRLASRDERRARVVEYRVFCGLSTIDTARLLGVSTATVERDWRTARAWLSAEVLGEGRQILDAGAAG